MASIIKASINLNNIDKSKIIEGKKGKYLPITITLNDELDQFGNQGPIVVAQTKEERETKTAKTYLGNVQVVWTNGDNVAAAPREDQPQQAAPVAQPADDLPFQLCFVKCVGKKYRKRNMTFAIYAPIAETKNNGNN